MELRRIVVAGALASKPGNGGEAWVRLSWVKGLMRMGFDVWFVEELGGGAGQLEREAAIAWFWSVVQAFGIDDRCVLVDAVLDEERVGPADDRVVDVLRHADLLINISGNLRRADLLRLPRRRAYVDLDPGFTQIWAADKLVDLGLQDHELHFSVGENIGTPRSPLPAAGFRWLPCRQPVILEDWPKTTVPGDGALSTVATWRCGYGPVAWDGVTYGLKLHEFRKVIGVPQKCDAPLELALDLHPADEADRRNFAAHGWRVREASEVVATPDTFRSYVQASAGEFSVAQGVYVHGRTGWFSDRSTRYLASGRPVIVQNSGLPVELSTDEGLVVFDDADGAIEAIHRVRADLAHHAEAARKIAEVYFASDVVLGAFVDRSGLG